MILRKIATVMNGLLIGLTLSACWDSQLLTNKKIVNGISFDAGKDSQLEGSVRTIVLESKGGGQFDVKDEFKKAAGASSTIVASKIDNMLPGTVEISKTHIIIIGEELAKKGILAPLEPIFRSPKGFLEAHLLISKGKASEILGFKRIENNPIAFGIKQILEGAHRGTLVMDPTLYSVWSGVYDPGSDLVLPLIRKATNSSLAIDGIALMQGSRYSGVSVSGEESTILLLMRGTLGKIATLNFPAEHGVISFQVRKLIRKMSLTIDKGTSAIECTVKVELFGSIVSDSGELGSVIDKAQLGKKLSASANAQAAGVIRQMQQADCDALGIGRLLSVQQPGLWKKMNWENEYKDITIKPDFHIHIRSTGLLN
ncbi:Ger(x)C family germination protein [Paenibacillus taihuensis]|uniref:Ger(X)C family germination protein n=1 Tax=Paenibacillus taihuensis TaxID=1156355 RepID=A0A3D9R3F6_9BACL|nr:Ger(x)C family spore germination protein [Paenibacillus taihuensis]REE70539.1 Ger(x)C family germination protein [Paenibacillus taihuensis]